MGAVIARSVVVGSAMLGALCTALAVTVVVAGLFRSHAPQSHAVTAFFAVEAAGPAVLSRMIVSR
jgi:hypothetical protein